LRGFRERAEKASEREIIDAIDARLAELEDSKFRDRIGAPQNGLNLKERVRHSVRVYEEFLFKNHGKQIRATRTNKMIQDWGEKETVRRTVAKQDTSTALGCGQGQQERYSGCASSLGCRFAKKEGQQSGLFGSFLRQKLLDLSFIYATVAFVRPFMTDEQTSRSPVKNQAPNILIARCWAARTTVKFPLDGHHGRSVYRHSQHTRSERPPHQTPGAGQAHGVMMG
jgi:hypothetical protein